jgi:hypothetical protein
MFGRELQNRKFFFTSGNKQEEEQEMKKYKQIRQWAHFALHTTYPNFIEWCTVMEARLNND